MNLVNFISMHFNQVSVILLEWCGNACSLFFDSFWWIRYSELIQNYVTVPITLEKWDRKIWFERMGENIEEIKERVKK